MTAPPKRVLVVEDDSATRAIEERILEAAGFEVVSVSNGFEALRVSEDRSFDLYVIDVMMPGMTGFDLAAELRKKTKGVPILFVTARGDDDSMSEGLGAGTSLYLVKPFSTATLLTMVRGALATAEAVES